MKKISRQTDIDLITKIYNKHKAHVYRWIKVYARQKYQIIWSDYPVHLCCKYANNKDQGKHYHWSNTEKEHEKINNLVWNELKYLTRPFEVFFRYDSV